MAGTELTGDPPEIRIVVAQSVELVTAAFSFSAHWLERNKERDSRIVASEEVQALRDRIAASISFFEQSDLDLIFSSLSTTIGLIKIAREPSRHDPRAFLEYLGSLDGEELHEHYRKVLDLPAEADLRDPATIAAAIAADGGHTTYKLTNEAEMIAQSLANPLQFRDRLVRALEWFYDHILSELLETTTDQCRALTSRIAELTPQQRVAFLDRLSTGNYETLLAGRETLDFHPIWIAATSMMLLIPDDAFMVVGSAHLQAALDQRDPDTAVRERTEELLKALSDPTRLAIMRLLRQQPRYGKELADALEVTPATASYHVDKLMQAKLVRLQLSQGRRAYYGINPHGVEELQSVLATEFLPGGGEATG